MEKSLIPEQKLGGKLSVKTSIECDSMAIALVFFKTVSQRLKSINQWDELCQVPSSVFKLINNQGREIVGLIQEGDYIRINIPGPGTKVGEGYDWVKVETIIEKKVENGEILSITVHPSVHPQKPLEGIAHFFSHQASSTFQVIRTGKSITVSIYGRNELPNNKTPNIFDNFRNTFVGWLAKIGLSYPQWKGLAAGLIR